MQTIDASIPLQVKPMQLDSPMQAMGQVMNMKQLQANTELKNMELANGMQTLKDQQELAQLAGDPSNIDPKTGGFKPEAMTKVSNPMLRQKLNQSRMQQLKEQAEIDWKTSQTALNADEAKTKALHGVMEEAYSTYEDTRARTGNEQAATDAFNKALAGGYDEIRTTGRGGFPKDTQFKMLTPQEVGAKLIGHKERMDEAAKNKTAERGEETPIIKETQYVERLKGQLADLPVGSPQAKTIENQIKAVQAHIAKMDAPARTTINTGDAESAKLQPDELRFMATQALSGDTSVFQNIGRGRQGAGNIAALRREMMAVAAEKGMSPEDVAMKNAEFFGLKAGERTLGTRQAQIEMAGQVLNQFIPIAKEASDAYKRTGIKKINDLQKAVQSGTASPELRKLNASVNAVINAYGRAINPTGVGNEADKVEARKILDSAFASGDFDAAIDQMQLEINAELKAPGKVKTGMRELFTGTDEKKSVKDAPPPQGTRVPGQTKWRGHTWQEDGWH